MASRRKKQINVDVGHNIRVLRERAGLSREEFAERVEISARFCATIEVGLAGISLETLKKICEELHVSADMILWEDRQQDDYAQRITPMLAGVDPELLPILEESIRTQVRLIAAAKRQETP